MQGIPIEIKLTYIIAFVVLLLFLVFIVAVVLIYSKRQKYFLLQQESEEVKHQNELLQKELEKQLALQSERDRISNDMHDDLGSGLSSIKLISEMLKIKHSDLETKNDLNEIVDYATDLTDTMREMVWSLNPRNDSLSKFVDHSIAYAKHFFEPSDIKFEVTTSPEFPEITMSGFVRRNLFLSLKEIFNNIIKHSGARKVSFSIKYVDNKLFIIIQDDGKGIADNSMKGNGLYSLKKRIADCEGVIVWKNMDFGLSTSITVSL
jgi:two-component system sensor histidine kinase DesK